MDIILESFQKQWVVFLDLVPKILAALIVLIIAVWIGKKLGKTVIMFLAKTSLSGIHKGFFLNTVTLLFTIFGLIIALNILGLEKAAASLLAGGGITAVVLGFAFREIGENFLAGFFLALSRPFKIGDTIQSGDFIGIVKVVELRSTHIRTADGRDIFIPSSQIFNQPLVNYTKDGLRRPSFTVGIDYRDDAMQAIKLLLNTTKKVDGVLQDPAPGVSISELSAQFVLIEVFFWLDVFKEGIDFLKIKNEVMDRCRIVLLENNFTVSSETTSNIALESRKSLEVSLEQKHESEI